MFAATTNNASGINSSVFQSFVARARWQEVFDFMPSIHDRDQRYDLALKRRQAPKQNVLISCCGSCGLAPDEALIRKENEEGPVGRLGKLIEVEPSDPDQWLTYKLKKALELWVKIDESQAGQYRRRILDHLHAKDYQKPPATKLVVIKPDDVLAQPEDFTAIETALKAEEDRRIEAEQKRFTQKLIKRELQAARRKQRRMIKAISDCNAAREAASQWWDEQKALKAQKENELRSPDSQPVA
jgi:hypothetical protein